MERLRGLLAACCARSAGAWRCRSGSFPSGSGGRVRSQLHPWAQSVWTGQGSPASAMLSAATGLTALPPCRCPAGAAALLSKVTLEALPKDTWLQSHPAAPDTGNGGSRERRMASVEQGDGWDKSEVQRWWRDQ